jgi:hypothetical protein
MINISKSRQLINLLQNSNIDENMTVKDLIERVSNNIKKYEANILEEDNAVIKKYTNVYLKFHDDDSGFGTKELSVMYIKTINPESYTDRWERTYALEGDTYSFNSIMGVNHREFKPGHVNSSYTVEKLKNYIQITEDEYLEYKTQYLNIFNALQNVINE